MSVTLLQGDALALPLAAESVDLIVTSPPYFALRSYTDGGEHYAGQLGSEPTPGEFLAALVAATAEMVRVLKPTGSIWVNLGDKYSSGKSLLGLPWRYAIRCMDELGLILRAEVIWSKPNGLPESVTDRVRRSHEQWFHFVKSPRYYAAVDEIRERYSPNTSWKEPGMYDPEYGAGRHGTDGSTLRTTSNPLGKLPGSVEVLDDDPPLTIPPAVLATLTGRDSATVWSVPTQPLTVPAGLDVDHFAAFPMEWPRRIVRGWSPSGICTACGEGRRPVTDNRLQTFDRGDVGSRGSRYAGTIQQHQHGRMGREQVYGRSLVTITGEVCACTPYTDHPGTDEAPRGWREYHHDRWTPPPTRPAVVLDPFGGTGTVALVADVFGRHGISNDRSRDYGRIAEWRTADPAQRASALQVEKPPPVPAGMESLFDLIEDGAG